MASLLFPDNTVLVNFACVHKIELLELVLDRNGRWCEAVADEATASVSYEPDIEAVFTGGWLGTPIEIDDEADVRAVDSLRRNVFGGPNAKPREHLGEAQTCHVLSMWPEYKGSVWVSDDQSALEYARTKFIPVLETKDLMGQIIQLGKLRQDEAYALIEQMRAEGHGPRLPASPLHF